MRNSCLATARRLDALRRSGRKKKKNEIHSLVGNGGDSSNPAADGPRWIGNKM